eukprot:5984721-Alexandrium_andersonii.AAC.1
MASASVCWDGGLEACAAFAAAALAFAFAFLSFCARRGSSFSWAPAIAGGAAKMPLAGGRALRAPGVFCPGTE